MVAARSSKGRLVFPDLADQLQGLSPSVIATVAASLLALLLAIGFISQFRGRRRAHQAALQARGQLETITARMREGVVAYDLQHQLTFANPAFERLTGFSLEDLRDQEFLQYVHPDDRHALLAEWDRLAKGGDLRDQEYRIVTRSGAIRWSSSEWKPLRNERGRQIGYLGIEFDITERKLAEDSMRLDAELFQAVIESQRAVAGAGLDSTAVMQVIVDRSQGLTGAHGAVIEGIEGEDLVPRVHVGLEAPRLPLAGSLSGLCVRTGELQRSDDVSSDPRIEHAAYQQIGVRSLLVMPLKHEQQIVGVLKVVSKEPHAFTDRDAQALRLLGGLMGAALGHAAAFEGRQARLEERTRAMQDSEQRFKQLVDVAQEGIWVADDQGIITYVNPRMAELLGYQNGALLGHPVFEFIDDGSRTNAIRALMRPSAAAADSQDLRFRRKDGSELWGLVSATPIVGRDGGRVGIVGMVTDITQRKQAEAGRRRSAERLAALNDMDQAILAARSPAEIGRAALGRLRRMIPCQRCTVVMFDLQRQEAQMIAGYAKDRPLAPDPVPLGHLPAGEVLRRGAVRYIEDLTRADELPEILRPLAEDGMRSILSIPLIVDSETIGEIEIASMTPATFDSEHREIAQEIAAPVAIAIQHARLRDELGRQTAELERRMAERGAALRAANAELETLLYSISHDLRAPARHLGGFAQLLLDDCGPALDPTVRHYAERIREGASRMASLMDDLALLARIGRQDLLRRDVDLNTLVEDVVGELQPQLDSRQVEWHIEQLPVVECDPALARIAISSLLSNALKFTRTREAAQIRIRPIESDNQAGIAIQDNGVGFKMAYAGKLFGLFQRLHRNDEFEGNGAGLALVQRIVHKHGGRVWAESELDAGATFNMTFGRPARRAGEEG
jgi:PAS domain S-box-containing protein